MRNVIESVSAFTCPTCGYPMQASDGEPVTFYCDCSGSRFEVSEEEIYACTVAFLADTNDSWEE